MAAYECTWVYAHTKKTPQKTDEQMDRPKDIYKTNMTDNTDPYTTHMNHILQQQLDNLFCLRIMPSVFEVGSENSCHVTVIVGRKI